MSTPTSNPARAFTVIQPPIGSRVKMSDLGKWRFADIAYNPHQLIGTISSKSTPHIIDPSVTEDELGVSVKWDNGHANAYNIAHLDIVYIPFKVGDLVTMSAIGMKRYSNYDGNPHAIAGTVTKLYNSRIIVKWSNECTNGYDSNDLMPVQEIKTVAKKDISPMPAQSLDQAPIIGQTFSDKLTVKPEFLKAAYKAACSEWKEKLVKEYPDFEFVRPERTFKAGDTICIDTAWGPADYAIVHSGCNKIILVNKEDFAPWASRMGPGCIWPVVNQDKITVAEMNQIVGTKPWHGKPTITKSAK